MTSWRSAWRSLRSAAGLPHVRFHDGRHTALTRLAEKGVADWVIRAQFGHVSPAMMAVYSHVRRKALYEAAKALEPDVVPAVAPPAQAPPPKDHQRRVMSHVTSHRGASRKTVRDFPKDFGAPCKTRTCDLLVRRLMQVPGLVVLRVCSSDQNPAVTRCSGANCSLIVHGDRGATPWGPFYAAGDPSLLMVSVGPDPRQVLLHPRRVVTFPRNARGLVTGLAVHTTGVRSPGFYRVKRSLWRRSTDARGETRSANASNAEGVKLYQDEDPAPSSGDCALAPGLDIPMTSLEADPLWPLAGTARIAHNPPFPTAHRARRFSTPRPMAPYGPTPEAGSSRRPAPASTSRDRGDSPGASRTKPPAARATRARDIFSGDGGDPDLWRAGRRPGGCVHDRQAGQRSRRLGCRTTHRT